MFKSADNFHDLVKIPHSSEFRHVCCVNKSPFPVSVRLFLDPIASASNARSNELNRLPVLGSRCRSSLRWRNWWISKSRPVFLSACSSVEDKGEFLKLLLYCSSSFNGEFDSKIGNEKKDINNERNVRTIGSSSSNTTKHLLAGGFAATVSRTLIAPLERLKLQYVIHGEKRNILELVKIIATAEGIKGFWKGNFVNILRTAPFKAINFCAYDAYRNQLVNIFERKEITNYEMFVAGAAAGITATLICLPMDTIRTKMLAPGGEVFGGIMGTIHHMIQTEGFLSLYKGLGISIVSMAPSGAVFYGVYDILKRAYLQSPEGRRRINCILKKTEENALKHLELDPGRTLLYGAIAGACSEAATYPFEVVRRHLQMQVPSTKMSATKTFIRIIQEGGIPALYAGLFPSLLQVLPSAGISYLVYEFMKIILKVEIDL